MEGYYNFLVELRESDFFEYDHSKIITLDFVTSSYRSEREKTIGIIGGKQKKLNQPKPTYTSTILVPAAYKSGLGLTAIVFTHDPKLNLQDERHELLWEWLDELGIAEHQVVYEASNKYYCAEFKAFSSCKSC